MSLFIPVRDPEDIRRDMLTAMKQSITALRKYEEFRKIRAQKMAAMHELVAIWHDTARLMRKLKIELPKTDVKAMPAVREPIHPVAQPVVKQAQPAPKHAKSKVDLLEEQLAKIEMKLQGITTD
jgi:hypothetical protein